MKWFYILIVLCLGLLFLMNPDMGDFREYIKEESRRMIQEEVSAPGLADVLSGAGSQLAETFVDNDEANRYVKPAGRKHYRMPDEV